MTKLKRDYLFTTVALFIIFASYLSNGFMGLSADAVKLLAVFVASLILWIFVSIDWTSLITILFLGLIPNLGFNQVFKDAFGNSTVVFLIMTFMLVYPLSKTNFVKRCTIFFITNKIAAKGPWFFVAFLFASVTFMGLFISPSVLFVAFLPFLKDIIEVLGFKKGSKTANMLTMGSAICINLSSGMTAIGHVWPTMAIGYYKTFTGLDINQFEYMLFGIPSGLIIIILLFLAYRFIYRPDDINEVDISKAMTLKDEIPPVDIKEKVILSTMLLTVILWVAPSLLQDIMPELYSTINSYTSAFPPLIGSLILFLVKIDGESILNFKEVTSKGILWGSVIMTAAATALGSALTNESLGIITYLSQNLSQYAQSLSPTIMIAFFVLWALIETNFSSNIVTTTVVSSVALTVLTAINNAAISIAAVIMMIGFAASVCNMTPAGQSTVNTVAIGSSYTDTKSMFIWGLIVAIIAFLVLVFISYPLASLIVA